MLDPGPVQPDDYIKAEHIEFLRELARDLGVKSQGSNVAILGPGLAVPVWSPGLYILVTAYLTGSGNGYAWTESIFTGSGWASGPRSGTTTVDPAQEINGNIFSIPTGGIRVRAWRSEGGSMLFQFGACT